MERDRGECLKEALSSTFNGNEKCVAKCSEARSTRYRFAGERFCKTFSQIERSYERLAYFGLKGIS